MSRVGETVVDDRVAALDHLPARTVRAPGRPAPRRRGRRSRRRPVLEPSSPFSCHVRRRRPACSRRRAGGRIALDLDRGAAGALVEGGAELLLAAHLDRIAPCPASGTNPRGSSRNAIRPPSPSRSARRGQDDRVGIAGVELGEPGVDVATDGTTRSSGRSSARRPARRADDVPTRLPRGSPRATEPPHTASRGSARSRSPRARARRACRRVLKTSTSAL